MYTSNKLATRIKERAKEQEISIKELLEECDLNKNAINELSKGKAIAFDSLALIADVLECSVDFLLGRSQNVNAHMDNTENKELSEEQRLVAAFRKLTDEGKTRVLDEAEMCANTPKFQKYTDIPREA